MPILTRPRSIALLAATPLLAGCASASPSPPASIRSSAATTQVFAKGALRVRMDGFAGGPSFALPDNLGGRPLVLNVWASWCTPCRKEMPAFQGVYRQVGDRVGFLGLDQTDQVGAAAGSRPRPASPTGWPPTPTGPRPPSSRWWAC
jgi:thiol-disulfide isomerase/thioredoxin